MLPDGFGDEDTSGVEYAEFTERRFGVELDDLGVVADDGDRATEWGAGHLVAAQVHMFPPHLVYLQFPIETVAEKLPLRRNGDVRHCSYRERDEFT